MDNHDITEANREDINGNAEHTENLPNGTNDSSALVDAYFNSQFKDRFEQLESSILKSSEHLKNTQQVTESYMGCFQQILANIKAESAKVVPPKQLNKQASKNNVTATKDVKAKEKPKDLKDIKEVKDVKDAKAKLGGSKVELDQLKQSKIEAPKQDKPAPVNPKMESKREVKLTAQNSKIESKKDINVLPTKTTKVIEEKKPKEVAKPAPIAKEEKPAKKEEPKQPAKKVEPIKSSSKVFDNVEGKPKDAKPADKPKSDSSKSKPPVPKNNTENPANNKPQVKPKDAKAEVKKQEASTKKIDPVKKPVEKVKVTAKTSGTKNGDKEVKADDKKLDELKEDEKEVKHDDKKAEETKEDDKEPKDEKIKVQAKNVDHEDSKVHKDEDALEAVDDDKQALDVFQEDAVEKKSHKSKDDNHKNESFNESFEKEAKDDESKKSSKRDKSLSGKKSRKSSVSSKHSKKSKSSKSSKSDKSDKKSRKSSKSDKSDKHEKKSIKSDSDKDEKHHKKVKKDEHEEKEDKHDEHHEVHKHHVETDNNANETEAKHENEHHDVKHGDENEKDQKHENQHSNNHKEHEDHKKEHENHAGLSKHEAINEETRENINEISHDLKVVFGNVDLDKVEDIKEVRKIFEDNLQKLEKKITKIEAENNKLVEQIADADFEAHVEKIKQKEFELSNHAKAQLATITDENFKELDTSELSENAQKILFIFYAAFNNIDVNEAQSNKKLKDIIAILNKTHQKLVDPESYQGHSINTLNRVAFEAYLSKNAAALHDDNIKDENASVTVFQELSKEILAFNGLSKLLPLNHNQQNDDLYFAHIYNSDKSKLFDELQSKISRFLSSK